MGDHADYHLRFEAPLKGDTVGIGEAISHWTRVCTAPGRVAGDGADAVQAARSRNGQIATLILPENMAWDAAEGHATAPPPPPLHHPSAQEVAAAACALRQPGAVLLIDLCSRDMDIEWTLRALSDELGEAGLEADDFVARDLPSLPEGALTLAKVGEAMAALMPENVVLVDEGVSSSAHLAPGLRRALGHDVMTITGGSIGCGLPLGVGAAVACPDRKVVVLEGHGSGMYTLQSLWTMAREGLDVTTVVFANRGDQILRDELAAVGVTEVGRNAVRMFDVVEPTLDWVALAKGHGVEGVQVTDMAGFNAAFAGAMAQKGPRLIEVVC